MEGELALILIFGIPIVAIVTSHMRRMAEIKLRLREAAVSAGAEEIANLRNEIQELRDTTTRFDLSFDTMLQRLENRVERLEGQSRVSAAGSVKAEGVVREGS